MDNRIPIPTDNIYKFYAFFGLLLLMFSIGSSIYIHGTTNELIFSAAVEIETLNSIQQPSQVDEVKKKVIEKKLEIATQDKKFIINMLGFLIAISGMLMYYGFLKWHKEIQPIQDETARLQLEKLRKETRKRK